MVEVRHVSTPDADLGLSQAIDILLMSSATNTAPSEENVNVQKEEP